MPQSNHDDDKLIKLLEKLPVVKDARPMDEVYRKVQAGQRRKSRKPIFIPAFTAIAALLLFVVIMPTFFQNTSRDNYSMKQDNRGIEEDSATDQRSFSLDQAEEIMEAKMADTVEPIGIDHSLKNAVYEEDIKGHDIITFGVVDGDAFVVPISLTIPEKADADWVTMYKETAATFAPAKYGFREFLPLINAFKYNEKSKTVYVTIDHDTRDFFNKNEKYLMEMLKSTVPAQHVDLVKFVDENGKPVELGEYGIIQDLRIEPFSKNAYYSYEVNGEVYLVPWDFDSDSFAEALESMKKPPNDFYKPLILDDVAPVVSQEENEQALIRFKSPLNLDEGDHMSNIRMLEGILLTAKQFGLSSVQFDNIAPAMWDRYDFSQPIEVPYSVNLLPEDDR